MRTIPVWLFAMMLGAPQVAPGSTLLFSLDRGSAAAGQYMIELDGKSGDGFYAPHLPAGLTGAGGAKPADAMAIHVSEPVLRKLLAAVPVVKGQHCDAHNKSVAKTGVKTLRYVAEDKAVECTYNYSNEDRVNDATSVLEAIAETMQFGDRLASKLRFDRLGLDAEVDDLQSALTDGRALEVENIAPVLQSITNDERVMDRVRRKTARLLEGVGQAQARSVTDPRMR